MEKPKNLHAQPMDMDKGRGDSWRGGRYQEEGGKKGKIGITVIA